jgi:hypothetical protein
VPDAGVAPRPAAPKSQIAVRILSRPPWSDPARRFKAGRHVIPRCELVERLSEEMETIRQARTTRLKRQHAGVAALESLLSLALRLGRETEALPVFLRKGPRLPSIFRQIPSPAA